jgi:hypothetical protein
MTKVMGDGFWYEIGEPSLAYPEPELELEYIPEPRLLKPVYLEVEDTEGRGTGTVELTKITREEFLENWGFPTHETDSVAKNYGIAEYNELTMKNLQTWLRHQGAALYNPIWWRYHEVPLHPRRTRYPHRIGTYEHLHGGHRCRSLEKLRFPYIYVYIHKGPTYMNPSNLNWRKVSKILQVNDMEPNVYTEYGLCEKCGARVRWGGPAKTGDRRTSGAEGLKATIYKCKCGHEGQRPEIYPEPV